MKKMFFLIGLSIGSVSFASHTVVCGSSNRGHHKTATNLATAEIQLKITKSGRIPKEISAPSVALGDGRVLICVTVKN